RRGLSSRFLNTIDRESALDSAAAMPSLINSEIRMSLESITTSLYSVRCLDSRGRLRTYNRDMPFESVRKAAEADFPTRWGHFRIFGFVGTPMAKAPDPECTAVLFKSTATAEIFALSLHDALCSCPFGAADWHRHR